MVRAGRRTFAVLALVVALLAGSGMACAQSGPVRLRVSYNPVPFNAPTILMRQGLLEERLSPMGIQVEWVGGLLKGSLMTESMAAGELDIASVMGGTSAIVSFAGGRDIVLVAGYSRAPRGFGIVVRADSPIASVADLKGKVVVGPAGTEVHYLLARALEEAGLTLDDVQFLNDLVPNAINYVINGHADAALAVEPTMSAFESQGRVRVLRTGEGLMPGATFVAVRGQFLRDHPEVVVEYLRAQEAAAARAQDLDAGLLELAAAELDLPLPVVERVAAKYRFSSELDLGALEDLQAVADFLFERGLIARKIDVSAMIDRSLLDEARTPER